MITKISAKEAKAMIQAIEEKKEDLTRLCRHYRVSRLEIFGSAVKDNFQKDTSDLDFLVEFLPLAEGENADAYFGLLEDLQRLFGCPVDLVMFRAIRNPYFLEGIRETRTTLYAA